MTMERGVDALTIDRAEPLAPIKAVRGRAKNLIFRRIGRFGRATKSDQSLIKCGKGQSDQPNPC